MEKYYTNLKNELKSKIKSKNPKIIIWGISSYTNIPISQLSEYEDVIIWDKNSYKRKIYLENIMAHPEGSTVKAIENPNFENICEKDKEGIYFVLAFTTEENVSAVTHVIKKQGYTNIIDLRSLIETCDDQKISTDIRLYTDLCTEEVFKIENGEELIYKCWNYDAGIPFNDDYLIQDLWGAKKVYEHKPSAHYDIGSRIDGFITHLLSFNTKVVLIDIRPLQTYGTPNIDFIQTDATLLSDIADNSIESLSALCSLEHFGLGMYGDPIDPNAHLKVFKNIQRVMRPDGNLYISVPVSDQSFVLFNANRVYSPYYIIDKFDEMELVEFSITSGKGLIKDVPLDSSDITEFIPPREVIYGDFTPTRQMFGLFHFRKNQ